MARVSFALAFAAALLAAAPAQAVPRKLPPLEQCSGDPELVKFRAALNDAAKREDGKALLALFAPDAKRPAGYGPPRPGEQSDPSDIMPKEDWNLLGTILRAGCARSGEDRIIPSVPVQVERYSDDELTDRVLILAGAKLYGQPYEEKSVTATLAWDVAKAVGTGGDFWTGVRLSDGRTGWVSDDQLYWLNSDYWIRIGKRQGQWMIVEFW